MSNVGRANLEQAVMALVSEYIADDKVDHDEAESALLYIIDLLKAAEQNG